MNIKILTVSKLNGYIKNIFNHDVILNNVSVKGELSNVKNHSSGHIYFSLKDQGGVILCVMFKTNANLLTFNPKEGMEVVLKGYVSVYEKTGQYQLYVQEMKISGDGDLYQKFEQVKRDLSQKGLFDVSFKKALPTMPRSIGIITSETGAALQDILSVLNRRNPSIKIYLYPVLVQGDRAKYEIVEGIELANKQKKVDVIIVGRGGGSIEDLWAFNEEIVAQSIFDSNIPIITAIGHETDFTIADFVADLRAPTPSAAAELATISLDELSNKIKLLRKNIIRGMTENVKNHRVTLKGFKRSHLIRHPYERLNQYRQQLDYIQNTSKSIMIKRFQEQRVKWLNLQKKYTDIISEQGKGKIFNEDGIQILSIKNVHEGEKIDILLKDGIISSKIIKIIEGDNNGGKF